MDEKHGTTKQFDTEVDKGYTGQCWLLPITTKH